MDTNQTKPGELLDDEGGFEDPNKFKNIGPHFREKGRIKTMKDGTKYKIMNDGSYKKINEEGKNE